MRRRGFLAAAASIAATVSCGSDEAVATAPTDEVDDLAKVLDTSTKKVALAEAARRIRAGMSAEKVLIATFVAGIRTLRPDPIGFYYHAVLQVESLLAVAAKLTRDEAAVVALTAVGGFKQSQALEVDPSWQLGSTTAAMPADPVAQLDSALNARDAARADIAVIALHRAGRQVDAIEALITYGSRGTANLGHEMIHVINSWRLLQRGNLSRAEDVLRALSLGIVTPPADDTEPVYLTNRMKLASVRKDWPDGKADPAATLELLAVLRAGTGREASDKAIELLTRGVGPTSLWNAILAGAAEQLWRSTPGTRIVGVHAVTAADALLEASRVSTGPNTKLLCLLQGAAWIPANRAEGARRRGTVPEGTETIDAIAPMPSTLDDVFAEKDPFLRGKRIVGYLATGTADALFARMRPLVPHAGEEHYSKLFDSITRHEAALDARVRGPFIASIAFHMHVGAEPDSSRYQDALQALSVTPPS